MVCQDIYQVRMLLLAHNCFEVDQLYSIYVLVKSKRTVDGAREQYVSAMSGTPLNLVVCTVPLRQTYHGTSTSPHG